MKQAVQYALACLALTLSMHAVQAQTSNQSDSSESAQGAALFDRMQQALRELNFDASFVHVRGQRIEPYRWLHSRSENGNEIEVLAALNGPEYRALRHNNHVSYYHSLGSPYSLRATVLNGPLPAGFFQPFEKIAGAYNVMAVGGGRVMDRAADHIRVIARDRQRYGYSIWVDRETGMLLRTATLSVHGDVLEQVQLTTLFTSDSFLDNLRDVSEVSRPPLVDDNSNRRPLAQQWQIGWLPQGFELIRSNNHRMAVTGQPVDYYLYTDGLAKLSIYISARNQATSAMQIEGAESLHSTELGEYQVTVVGGVPAETAQRIAQSVRTPR
ncbi:MucB/RseB C-terminal domain-containing protein [Aliidiomarina soli]|uniref:Negative regulator of sigma E activity n=1 Tax=Aliidiomarina soli TaxID=1928574 RepID=A0A432WLR7_9GAMM|nr:MucB/RseB C-terminal domain-containing protein [Aliidiomarina soli]RUO34733.1 negative regulator of sigma E activity [Aliidiomarina soli]